jgi:hypothetical protein
VKNSTIKRALALGILSLCTSAVSVASIVGFEFGTNVVPSGYSIPNSGSYIEVGTEAVFTIGGHSITASAFNNYAPSRGYNITVDNNSIEERGLGVLTNQETGGTVREINSKEVVMLDFSNILDNAGTVASIRVGSLQGYGQGNPYESFLLYAFQSNAPTDFASATAPSNLIYSSTYADTQTQENVTIDLSAFSNYRYFTVQANPINDTASSNDVALDAVVVNVSNTPEPSTFVLLSASLASLAFFRKTKRAA